MIAGAMRSTLAFCGRGECKHGRPEAALICYRFAAYATPLRTVPAWQPARFSRGDEDEPTQYLALHPLGPLAELMRNAELRHPSRCA